MHGTVSALWISPWGRTLLAKVAFVGLAALLGSLTRFRCLGRPATSRRATTMTNLLRSEAAVMVAILSISGLLANASPSV
jgi:putative copper export protein